MATPPSLGNIPLHFMCVWVFWSQFCRHFICKIYYILRWPPTRNYTDIGQWSILCFPATPTVVKYCNVISTEISRQLKQL
jgi:hypothetical protein